MKKKNESIQLKFLDGYIFDEFNHKKHNELMRLMPSYSVLNGVISRIRHKNGLAIKELIKNGYR